MIYDYRSQIHDDIEAVSLYASPNVNATYTADAIGSTKWAGDFGRCAVCGKTRGIFAVHHEPPRSKGSLLLVTGWGRFVVKPTLLLLCAGCHADRHDRGLLRFRWEWADAESRDAFLAGEFFKAGYAEHDRRFWEHGRLMAVRNGMETEVTG